MLVENRIDGLRDWQCHASVPWSRFLQSATYTKSLRPVSSAISFHVVWCVWSSTTLPLAAWKQIGTPPSSVTVRMYSSCFKSGRWSLLCPQVCPELASTLAQGKPVVAFIPDVTDDYFQIHLKGVQDAHPGKLESEILLEQLQIYDPLAAWRDEIVRNWCNDPQNVDVGALRQRLRDSMKRHYDKRADTLRTSHPLGIQVNLQTGVGNGVLVVRTVPHCAQLIRNILLRELQFELEENEQFVALRERISDCVFRVTTGDAMLTNTFWNFYLDPTE